MQKLCGHDSFRRRSAWQQSVLAGIDDERRLRTMYAVGEINRRHGRHTVRPLALSADRGWDMRRQRLSPRYTTRINEVLRVKAR